MTQNRYPTTISRDDVEQLMSEAQQAGDHRQVEICAEALEHGTGSEAWQECRRVIAEAWSAAQDQAAEALVPTPETLTFDAAGDGRERFVRDGEEASEAVYVRRVADGREATDGEYVIAYADSGEPTDGNQYVRGDLAYCCDRLARRGYRRVEGA